MDNYNQWTSFSFQNIMEQDQLQDPFEGKYYKGWENIS